MKKLKTAIIGLGRIGWQYHAPEIIQHDNFALTAAVDPVAERRDEARNSFGITTYSSTDELFKNEKIDIAVIASPTQFHKNQTLLAMENGCDVFCDKPMAINAVEAEEMIGAAKRLNRKLMIYQPHRGTAETLSLLNILSQNIIGDIFMIKLNISEYTRRNDWQAFIKHGGGMLANYGAHYIDLLLTLTDFSPVDKITCHLKTIASSGDADDVVKMLMCNRKGTLLDLDINMASPFKTDKWHIMGQYGAIKDNGESWSVKYFNPDSLADLPVQNGMAAENRQYRTDETIPWHEMSVKFSDFPKINFYSKVYEYFTGNSSTAFVPVSQTLSVMHIIQKCRENLRNSQNSSSL